MEFGKVLPAEIKNIDFSLPPDRPETKLILKNNPLAKSKKAKVYIGCAKWGRKEWVGKIYPKGTKDKDFLEHYAKKFNCIEFNAMFYRIFPESTIEGWVNKVNKDFLFCPKFTKDITHIKRLKNAEKITDAYLNAINTFGKNLGPCFLQLSDNYGPKEFDNLKAYLKSLPKDLEVFIEVRHKEWYAPDNAKRLFEMLAETNFGTVITDASGRRDCVHMALTTPKAFIRFVGNGLHPTDYTRIDDWVKRIKSWMNKGIHEVYFFMHQHDELHSPALCVYTIRELNKACGLNIPVPTFIEEKGLFD
jgi:uncharacterized protein YecE (DUF72 family)